MDKSVAVFMPCYNCRKYVKEAIESILNQTYTQFRLVIVDDGSTDESVEVVQKLMQKDSRIQLFHNPENRGIVFTRNRGLELCDCDYLALMDADDISAPDRLEKEVAFLNDNPDITVVGGLYQLIDSEGRIIEQGERKAVQSDEEIRAHMIFHNVIANGSVLIRKKEIDRKGLQYRQDYQSAEDYRFWSEVLSIGKMHNINQVFQYYRVHENSLEHRAGTSDNQKRQQGIYQIKQHLLREQGYQLEPAQEQLFLEVLMGKTELSKKERCALQGILRDLASRAECKGSAYAAAFLENLEGYKRYTHGKLARRLIFR